MIVPIEKPGTPAELVHVGVKGMHWGVRKQEPQSSPTYSAHGVKGLEKFPVKQARALDLVAGKMKDAYGLKVDAVVPITKRSEQKMIAYVNIVNKGSNTIHMQNGPELRETLLRLEKAGWFPPSNGHVFEINVTHESAHALFHTVESRSIGNKTKMDGMRKEAWRKAQEQAEKDGDIEPRPPGFRGLFAPRPEVQMGRKISKYAGLSIFREEAEAEMFSAYHWSPNPPKFVDAFMNNVHDQMGKKVQPFSGRKVNA